MRVEWFALGLALWLAGFAGCSSTDTETGHGPSGGAGGQPESGIDGSAGETGVPDSGDLDADGASCAPELHVCPWSAKPATQDAGASSDGGGSEGCVDSNPTEYITQTDCHGAAIVGSAAGETTLTLADGSVFTWNSAGVAGIDLPAFGGSSVRLDYQSRVTKDCGGFCNRYESDLTLRRSSDDALVFAAGNHDTSDPKSALEKALGGSISVHEVCRRAIDHICYSSGTKIQSDYTLSTTPEQVLHFDQPTKVTTNTGEYVVAFVDANFVDLVHDPNVADCGASPGGSAYLVSRSAD
jgi:hypothetical protein